MSILNLRVWKLGENKIIWELPIGAFLAQPAAWNDHFILRGSHICNVLDKLENLCNETCPKKNLSSLSSQQCQLRRRRISTSLWRKGKIFTNYWFWANSSLRFFWLSARNNSVIVWLSYLTQSLDFVCRLFAAVQPHFARPIRQKKSSKLVFQEKFPGRSFEFPRSFWLK